MILKRITALVTALAALPVIGMTVYAERFSQSFDMTGVKPNEEGSIVLEQEVPDGDYSVSIKTGGETQTNANIFINGGERVRAYTLEAGDTQDNVEPVVPKDGKIRVEVKGESPNVTEIEIEQLPDRIEKGDKPTIYIAGDSTAQTYDYKKAYPQTGWGQVLADYFTDGVIVENRAMGGRSSKSFDNDGRLDAILTQLKPGDYVFIQFGINDGAQDKPERYISVPDYKELITDKYIAEVEKRGGVPVLLTATPASWWDEENSCFMESRQDYAEPTREVAQETGAELIDVNERMTEEWKGLSKEAVLNGYFICEPLESKAYPEGTDDHTHLKETGARNVASVIVNAVKEEIPELAQYVKEYTEFTDMEGHWAVHANSLKAVGLFKGVDGDRFMPDKEISRAELLSMLMRVCNIPGHAYRDGECLDASEDDWYCYYLQSALDKGLIPDEMIAQCEKQAVTKTLAEASDDKVAVTVDIDIYNGSFSGDEEITREEAAALAVRCAEYAIENSGQADKEMDMRSDEAEFSDESKISSSYIDAVNKAYAYNIINGMGDGSFRPDETLTRAQASSIVWNVLSVYLFFGGVSNI